MGEREVKRGKREKMRGTTGEIKRDSDRDVESFKERN